MEIEQRIAELGLDVPDFAREGYITEPPTDP